MMFLTLSSYAQEWILNRTQSFDQDITAIGKNNQGDIYVGFANGSFTAYQKDGKEYFHNSEFNTSEITAIDATNRLRTMIFRREQQQLEFYDRFGIIQTKLPLDEIADQFVWLARQGSRNEIWLLTSDFLEILKYDQLTGATSKIPLNLKKNIELRNTLEMIVYKNVLIILDESLGLILFDQFGNYVMHNSEFKSDNMILFKDEIVLKDSLAYYFISPFDLVLSKKEKAPNLGGFNNFLFFDEQRVLLSKRSAHFYIPR